MDKTNFEIKSIFNLTSSPLTENNQILIKFLSKFIKYNNKVVNKSYYYNTIYISSYFIQGIFCNNSNNVFICLFNKKLGIFPTKLFLMHIFISYKNLYLKFSKSLENNEKLFSLIFSEIFLIPFINNFDRVYKLLIKKIDIILFGNSEYISSLLVDLDNHEIMHDIGNLFQKNYKSSFLQFKNRKELLNEICFHGIKLKNNYLKSYDKNLDKNDNTIKIELRATFPKPLFIIKFFPVLKGIVIVHLFNQYKLSKTQIKNPNNPNRYIYDIYKEIDIANFNLFEKLDENNLRQINIIEKFFFEYFLILGNNIKEIGNNASNLMTYKGRDFNLIYLNKDILKLIKDIIIEYYKDKKDLLYKLKKKLFEENDKKNESINNNNNKINININRNSLIIENSITKSERLNININNDNDNNNEKNILEFTYNNFIKEFKTNKLLQNKKDENELVELNDINMIIPGDLTNINEYSELNLSKDNIKMINRYIVNNTSRIANKDKEINIYNNNGIITSETNNLKTGIENIDNEGININTNEPFNIDLTSIANNIEISKDEWGFRSILGDKSKMKQK